MVKNYQEMLSSEHSGFIRHNGIRVVSVDEEKSVLTADVTPENSNIWVPWQRGHCTFRL